MKGNQAAALLLAATLFLTGSGLHLTGYAKVTEADKQKIESQLGKNDGTIAALQKELERLKAEKAAAIQIKEKLDAEAATLQDNIDLTEALIETYQQSIKDTILEIAEKQRAADAQYEQVKKYLRSSYENGNSNFLEILFSSSSLTELMTRTERLRSLLTHQESKIEELEEQRAYLAKLRERYEEDLRKTEDLKASLKEDKAQLDASVEEAMALMEELKKASDEAAQQKAAYEYAEAQLEKELAAIIKELERQAAAGIAQGAYIWPTTTKRNYISSDFGTRNDPFTGDEKTHNGIDIPCSKGDPIYASNNGVVVAAAYNNSYGYYVMLSHGDGITTLYAHNSKLTVTVGQVVQKGEVIAKAGSTGRSTGTHCHFEVRIDGVRVNPLRTSNRDGAYVVVPK